MPAAMATSLTPMPRPDSKRAPHFEGSEINEFLEEMESCAKAAGLEDTELPKLIPRYCSKKIKSRIKQFPEVKGTDWAKLKTSLIELFGSRDKPRIVRPDKLYRFSKKSSKTNMNSRRKLDEYTLKFRSMSGPLLEDNLLTENERNLLFYGGLPSTLRKKIKPLLEAKALAAGTTLSRSSAPAFDDILQFARSTLKKGDYDPDSSSDSSSDEDPDNAESQSSSSDSDSSSSDDDDTTHRHRKRSRSSKKTKKVRFEATTVETPRQNDERQPSMASTPPRRDTNVDIITEQLERMMINNIEAKIVERLGPATAPTSTPSALIPPRRSRCFLCDRTQPDAHRMGLRNCTELPSLLHDHLVTFNDQNRLVCFDGRELPMVPPGSGGVAAILRANVSSASKSKSRDAPPHQASVNTIELFDHGHPTFQRSAYTISAHEADSLPVTRAQTKRQDSRYNPATQERRHARIEEVTDEEAAATPPRNTKSNPAVRVEPPTSSTQPARPSNSIPPMPTTGPRAFRLPETGDVRPSNDAQPAAIPPRPHVDNTQEGWRARSREGDQDVEMKDNTPQRPRQAQYRFTSDVQEGISIDKIQDQIMSTAITLPFKEIIGISPDLQKRFANMTKTRREYTAKTGEFEYSNTHEANKRLMLTLDPDDDLEGVVDAYAGAITSPSSRFFAMSTGRFEGTFGGIRVSFMIDSGSELNLVSQNVFEQANLPLDADGTRWSLRGINGDPVPLLGCCRDVPITIGGHHFDHHFFVSSRNNSKTDVIIGQPWLHFYESKIDYIRGGGMDIHLYPDSRDANTCVIIRVAGTDTTRNQEKLVLTGEQNATPASVYIVQSDF
jgi:hypothetical protein